MAYNSRLQNKSLMNSSRRSKRRKKRRRSARQQSNRRDRSVRTRLGWNPFWPAQLQKDVEEADLMAKFKASSAMCSKLLNSSAILKPQLTKSKYEPGFLKKFQESLASFQTMYETLLTTMGTFEAGRCSKVIAAKAIGQAAKAYQVHKNVVAQASGGVPKK